MMRVTKSDIDQLVVGYVSEQRYFETRNKLFQESPNLPEKVPILSIFGDISSVNRLHTILNEYVQFKTKQLLPICGVCDDQASISDLWKIFDRIITKIRNHKEALPQKPTQELRRYSPTHFILDNSKSNSVKEASEPKAIQRKILNPISNEYEPESIIGPKQTNELVPTQCLESGRRKKTAMPRRFNNNNTNIPIAPFNNNQPVLLAYNGDLSKLLNLPDNNDALALVGCEILKNMKKCAEKGATGEPLPEISTSMTVTNRHTPQPTTPMKTQDAPALDIDDLISDETRGGLVEMTIDSLLNPEYEGLPDMTSSSINNVEDDFSELRKLLDLDESSSPRLSLPDLIQTKQDEKYLIEIINAPNDQDLPENPVPMDFNPQNDGAPNIQICEENNDEKFCIDGLLQDTNDKSNPSSCDTTTAATTSTLTHDIVAVATSALMEMERPPLEASVVNPVTVSPELVVTMTTDDVTSSHDFVNEDGILRSAPPIYTTADSQSGHFKMNTLFNDNNKVNEEIAKTAGIIDTGNTEMPNLVQNTEAEALVSVNKNCIAMPPKKRFLAKEGTTPTKSSENDPISVEAIQHKQNLDLSAMTGELLIDETSDVEETSTDCVLNNILTKSDSIEALFVNESPSDSAKKQKKSDSPKTVTEIDDNNLRKSKRQRKPRFSLKDIVGKRKDMSKNLRKNNSTTSKKSPEIFKNSHSDVNNEITESGVRVMKPGHGSVVINLKDRCRMPIHVKGIVVHTEKNEAISKEDIINQLVGQMHQPNDAKCSEPQKNVCATKSETPGEVSNEISATETVSKTTDPEPQTANLNLSQNINVPQFLSSQSFTPQGQNTDFISLLSTPPKLSYSKHFSTISPSAGIFSVISSNTNRSHHSSLTTSTPNQFSEARINLLGSFVQQQRNVSSLVQQNVNEVENLRSDVRQPSEYTELSTVTPSRLEVVQNQIIHSANSSVEPVGLATVQKTGDDMKYRNQGGSTKNRNQINKRKSAPQKVAKKQNRSIFLCSKMKNMVKIEPKKYGAPAVRKCIIGTTSNQSERGIISAPQVLNIGVVKTQPSSAPVHDHDVTSQSQPIDFDKFFDFGNDSVANSTPNAESLPKAVHTENFAGSSEYSCQKSQNFENQDQLQCFEKLPRSSKKNSERNVRKSQRKKERSLSREGRKKRKRTDTKGSPIMKWSYEKIQAKLNAIHGSRQMETDGQNESSCGIENNKDSFQTNININDSSIRAKDNSVKNTEKQLFGKKKVVSKDTEETVVIPTKNIEKTTLDSITSSVETHENLEEVCSSKILAVPISEKNRTIETYLSQYEAEKESAISSILQSKDDSSHSVYTRPIFQLEPLDLSLSGWPQSPQKNTFMSLTAAESNILSMASLRNLEDSMPHASVSRTTVSTMGTVTTSPSTDNKDKMKPSETERSPPFTNKENILCENSTLEKFIESVKCPNTESLSPINEALPICKTKMGSATKQESEISVSSERSQNTCVNDEKVRTKKRSRKKKDRLSMLMNLSKEEIQAKLDSIHCRGDTPRHDFLYEDTSNSRHNNNENISSSETQKNETHQSISICGDDKNSGPNVKHKPGENIHRSETSTSMAIYRGGVADSDTIIQTPLKNKEMATSDFFEGKILQELQGNEEIDIRNDCSFPKTTLENVETTPLMITSRPELSSYNTLESQKQKIKVASTKRKSPIKTKSLGKVSKQKV